MADTIEKVPQTPTAKPLSPEAERALSEAEARRASQPAELSRAPESGGRKGPDPVRYGDWEKGGLVSDF